MCSKAKILGHPIHPMLVGFPIAFYTAAVVAYGAYAARGGASLFHLGVVANIARVVGALVAAIPGFIDWKFGIPKGARANSTGLAHMILNVTALVLFAIDAALQLDAWNTPLADAGVALGLAAGGLVLTVIAGALGWSLVGTYHVGVDLSREQERLERFRAPHPSRP